MEQQKQQEAGEILSAGQAIGHEEAGTPMEEAVIALLDDQENFNPEWYKRYESLEGNGKTLSKFKSPEALAGSYARLEKMKQYPGVEQEDKMVAFRRLAGLPEKGEDYALARPEGVDEEHWNQALADRMSKVAYQYGVPPQAMDALGQAYLEAQVQAYAATEEERQHSMQEAEQELQNEWGGHYEQGMRQAVSMVEKLAARAGVDSGMILDEPAIASNAAFIKMMKEASSLIEEAPLKGGDALAPSPVQEALRIESDPSHPLHEAYMNHNHPNHKYANAMYDQLAFGK